MRKTYLLFVICTLGILSSINVHAQDLEQNGKWYLGIYSGITPYTDTDVNQFPFIRKSVERYDDYENYVNGEFYTWKLGVKLERRILNERLSFFTGVHYSNLKSLLKADDVGDSEFMLVNISQENQSIHFIRTTSFKQNSNYVGTQIGLRGILTNTGSATQLFIGGNIDINVLLDHDLDVDFYVPTMSTYTNDIKALFKSPSEIFSTINVVGGIKFGKLTRPNLTLEMGPSFLLTEENSSLTKANVGFNLSACFYLPL